MPLNPSTSEPGTEWENESGASGEDEFIGFDKVWSDSESCYSFDGTEYTSVADESIPEDTNMFLNEVIDSLTRGFDDKLKCDYLILEINSSRYAYNIHLSEVNFYVVRALLSLPQLAKSENFLVALRDVINFFRPIFANYIKTKSSIMDCLKAVEETCIQSDWLRENSGHVLLMLYDVDIIDEDSLLEFNEDLKRNSSPLLQFTSVRKFFEWLKEADEESDTD